MTAGAPPQRRQPPARVPQRLFPTACALAALVLAAEGRTRAQGSGNGGAPGGGGDGGAGPPRAEIALVGPETTVRPVREVVDELLSRGGVAVSWSRTDRLRLGAILEAPEPRPDGPTYVWIDLSSTVEARLYFRDASGQRFVIRPLPLQGTLDALVVEEIAQIVKAVLRALGAGTVRGLSRSEAQAALGDRAAPPPAVATTTPGRVSAEIGSAVLGQLYAPQLLLAGRVDASLAVLAKSGPDSPRPLGSLGGWLAFGYGLPARFQGDTVGVDLQSTSMRAGLLWEPWTLGSATLRLSLGSGVDRVAFRPRAETPGAVRAAADSFFSPLACLGAGIRWNVAARFALSASAVAEVPVTQVHFDVVNAGTRTQVLVPFGIRPGLSFGADWRL